MSVLQADAKELCNIRHKSLTKTYRANGTGVLAKHIGSSSTNAVGLNAVAFSDERKGKERSYFLPGYGISALLHITT